MANLRTSSRRAAHGIAGHTFRMLGYRESQVLQLVNEIIVAEGIAPSYSRIANTLGLNGRHKVCEIVKRLEKRGLLSRVGAGRVPSTVHAGKVRRIALGVAQ